MLAGQARGPAGHLVRRDEGAPGAAQQDRDGRSGGRARDLERRRVRRARAQHRHDVHRAQGQVAARRLRAAGHRSPASEARQDPGHRRRPAGRAGRARRWPQLAGPVPVHARGREPRRARPVGAEDHGGAAQAARDQGRALATSRRTACSSTSTIDRDTAARHGITAAAIDNTLYDAFGQRQVAVMYTEVNQYRVVLEADPSIGTGPEALDRLYVASASGAQVPLVVAGQGLAIDRRAVDPRTRASSRRRRSRSTSRRTSSLGTAVAAIDNATAQIGMPASIHGAFAGHRAGVRGVQGGRVEAARARAARRLHRARHALRELRPSDHDPVDAPVGGPRRAARADAVRQRPQSDRAGRHHLADRHRQEERDPDGRLRARAGARRASRPTRRSTRPRACGSGRS